MCGLVAEWLGSRTCDQQVAGSNPGRHAACRVQPWASCLHTCASVTRQYNLVPANGRWSLATGQVTAGLAENNGKPTAGFMASVTSRVTAEDMDQLRNHTLVSSMGLPLA